MTLWLFAVASLAAALATAALLSRRTSYHPVVVALAWGLAVDLVVGVRDPSGAGWGIALYLARRPWGGADVALWHLSNALVTSWPAVVAGLAWRAFHGPQKSTAPDSSEAATHGLTVLAEARGRVKARCDNGTKAKVSRIPLAVKAIAACWAAANAALIAHGVAPITRPFKAFEIGCVAAGGLAVWLGRRRRDAAPMAAAWLVALQVLVVTLGPYKADRDPYRDWDLARLVYALGFSVLAIGQAVAWRRLRPQKAGSPDDS
jgi:hypothetical protein